MPSSKKASSPPGKSNQNTLTRDARAFKNAHCTIKDKTVSLSLSNPAPEELAKNYHQSTLSCIEEEHRKRIHTNNNLASGCGVVHGRYTTPRRVSFSNNLSIRDFDGDRAPSSVGKDTRAVSPAPTQDEDLGVAPVANANHDWALDMASAAGEDDSEEDDGPFSRQPSCRPEPYHHPEPSRQPFPSLEPLPYRRPSPSRQPSPYRQPSPCR
ncbi:hypothetical protein L13192_06517 [Pyrenophora tritici-repentis]|uniref:Uncharacterized protein n=1 Tax=Pyrenophora tritici-repentis TaxID=45151 RepID=A0A922NDH4_9PLEO|nr:hypothetical protein Ptr86124_008986 [Pyrenophora tritici-repentis]KAI1669058.1 hypothetical protein L13192_06517 [Pyrenophora tritici-repentis]KAI1684270.1 hypothetical protein KJE20_06775 [Pyrenophora tritici-repentis]